jgi:PAS domain S-box-containing protein
MSLAIIESRESDAKYRGLLEAAPDAMVVVNKSGDIVLVNLQAEKQFGYSREELVGTNVKNIIPEGFAERLISDGLRSAETALAQQIGTGAELTVRRKNGTDFPIEIMLSPLETAEGILVTAAIRDISVRKGSEETLARLAAIVESSNDAILSKSLEGIIQSWNLGAERLYGYSATEAVGQSVAILAPPLGKDEIRDILERIGKGERVEHYETRRMRKNGQRIDVSLTISPVKDSTGKVVGASTIGRDITDEKRAEAEIKALNITLRERIAELDTTNKELEAFTYSVSHDLRAPLRHVDGFSKLLVEKHRAELSTDALGYVEIIRDSVLQMGMLIDDLLNLTRVGRTQLSMQVTGLNSLVEEVRADLARANPDRMIEWKVETLPFADCDPGLMKQVFVNLLSNAVKFTRPRKPAIIEVGAVRQDGQPVVFVRDNGVGFSMKYAKKLFGVFQRLHRAEDFEGTGVGLATVQRIIRKHGGRVWAEAGLDKGATFYFTLASGDDPQPQDPTNSGGTN